MARRLPGRPPASTATQKASFLSAPWHPARDAFETCPLQPWTILAGVPSPICPDPATAEARSPASGSTSGAPWPPALLWDVLDLYDRRWDGRALTAEEFVISANEKTQIPIRSTSHQILPPAPGRSIRVEHEYRRHGVCAYIAAWDVHRARLFGEVVSKISIVALDAGSGLDAWLSVTSHSGETGTSGPGLTAVQGHGSRKLLGTSLATPCCPSMPGPPPQRRQPRGAPCRSPPGTRRRRPRPRPPVPAWAGAPGSPLGGRRCGAAPITVADPCGSRSITAACPPTRSWAAARATARVVFPLPPFCEISAIVRIMLCTLYQVRPSPCQPDRPADHSDSVRLSGFR